ILAIPVVLTLGSIRLLMFAVFLNIEYTRPGFPVDVYGFTTADRLEYSPYALNYILSDTGLSYFDDLRLPPEKCYPVSSSRDCPLYNDRELGHLHDVKVVVQMVFGIGLIMFGWMSISIMLLWSLENPRRSLQRAFFQGSLLTLCTLISIIALVLGAWSVFFDTFHALFFEAGTWQFYFSDTLIRLYPQQFWFDASLIIGTLVMISTLLIFAGSWRWGQHQSGYYQGMEN
ncbi:MAG: TIGR01906 family membrane protein, partial [Aggregatilineales bacterium]